MTSHHEHLLLPVLQERPEEGPSGADEHDDGEEDDALDELEEVERDVPAVRRAGDADVVLVLGGGDAVEHAGEEEAGHEVVDAVRGEAVVVEGEVEPSGEEDDVAEREEGVDRGDGGLADGEVVLGAVEVGVVHVGAYLHGDGGLGRAVGEEEAVLVGVGDGEGAVVVAVGVEVGEGEERDDVGAGEDAGGVGVRVGVQIRGRRLLVDGLEERLVGEEEEAELRGVRLGELGGGLGAG
jgi:hypothetical protein